MEASTSITDISSDSFKAPQPLSSQDVADNVVSTLSDKGDSSESSKSFSKPAKNRVDVPLPYKEPSWSGIPPSLYSFEIIKNGTFVETFNIRTSCVVFGRLDVCNIVFEHPSVSRYHAVIQYCQGDSTHPKGFYLYDLGSTHGTFLNKEKITPKIYYKLKVGYLVKFGGSSRLHIFQGPEEEEVAQETAAPKIEEDACSWGIVEDAEEEEEDISENPFALSTPNEELYLEDPKKTLRNWFEREGYELEYNVEEKGFKSFSCRIQLPIDTPTGDFLPVEAAVTGKKKEAVIACALEACRTLDRLGLLRQSRQESREKKKKKWEENDYYDSDEDTFLDRTGIIEKKREMRKRMTKKKEAETFESIEAKLRAVTDEINEITSKLSSFNKSDAKLDNNSEVDTLEAFMSNLSDSKEMAGDKIERRKLRFQLQEAEKEKAHLEKLLNIARPAKLPPVVKYPGVIGKRLKSKLHIPLIKPKEPIPSVSKSNDNDDDEEEDSDPEIMEVESTKVVDPSVVTQSKNKTNSDENNFKDKALPVEIDDKQESNIKEKKLYGLILNSESTDDQTTHVSSEDQSDVCSKKRVIGCEEPQNLKPSSEDVSPSKKKKKGKQQNVDVYTVGNTEYSTWVPPSGQTGDGMTHLNAKYGY